MYFAGEKNDYELQLLCSSVCAMAPVFFMDVSGKSPRETLNSVCEGVCVWLYEWMKTHMSSVCRLNLSVKANIMTAISVFDMTLDT